MDLDNKPSAVLQAGIFEDLQRKIDEDSAIKDALRDIVQTLEKQDRATQAILSRAHSTASSDASSVVAAAQASIANEVQSIQRLEELASKYPYYKFNYSWTRHIQDACLSILTCAWLGGFDKGRTGQLLTIDEVGSIMNVPVNLKDRDAFHLTIEEYLLALISLLDELARLARNSVTLGDYSRPLQISQFIKDIHAGFQILNLKNDTLRKRSDGIKYRVKEVEDVVYDLSLRGLLPKA
ncbi:Translin [Dissoconium aciculare CBS 342.82]|uniref:Translin n=1 Tax=Dissoconium aciculare CBS 342.82 TaxID=1314786 RepID=A0A6J3LZU6_9PEZI|nr:Translin [Dissoconium aciculare CBS 342.82]KAF1821188.1 Translin [Dissoconium aciculare CBS 342.82]